MRIKALGCLMAFAAVAGCSTSGPAVGGHGRLRVVAAENMWGSVAAQLGGIDADVTSIVANPSADPHSYEPTSADARAITAADLVIVNGIGYDPWASRLLSASPTPHRLVVDVGGVTRVVVGGNPHQWYDPASVSRVADAISAALTRLAPAAAERFRGLRSTFARVATAKITSLVNGIRAHYAGVPVGASESIVAPLIPSVGLDLRTPARFLAAISEGVDPTAADKAAIDAQIAQHQIAVYLYNSQNATPDIAVQVAAARSRGIPVVAVTETLVPAATTYQDWFVAELETLRAALARATGR
ncbi:MAG: zinc ABC transporter substrate-binding protein [Actinomycetota bacterium]|nr:zinc ABC transporter substrate-binding protein [Actinomycetota bacterium]